MIYQLFTYLFSAPMSKFASRYIVSYMGIPPLLAPVCVEMTSIIISQPVNLVIYPFISYFSSNLKLIMFKKNKEIENEYILIDEISSCS